jgi:hypothetical protein
MEVVRQKKTRNETRRSTTEIAHPQRLFLYREVPSGLPFPFGCKAVEPTVCCEPRSSLFSLEHTVGKRNTQTGTNEIAEREARKATTNAPLHCTFIALAAPASLSLGDQLLASKWLFLSAATEDICFMLQMQAKELHIKYLHM